MIYDWFMLALLRFVEWRISVNQVFVDFIVSEGEMIKQWDRNCKKASWL